MKNLTLTQKIAIKWLETIDSTAALFLLLKPLHVKIRVVFYMVLIVGTFIVSKFGLSFLDLLNSTTYIALIPSFGVAGIVFYESIFKLDIEEILKDISKEKREKNIFIKTHKLQKWRLRNMPWFLRFFIYFCLFIFIQQFLHLASVFAFFSTAITPTETQITQFLMELQSLMKYFTVGCILIVVTVEIFVKKNKRKAKQCLSQS